VKPNPNPQRQHTPEGVFLPSCYLARQKTAFSSEFRRLNMPIEGVETLVAFMSEFEKKTLG